MGAAAVLVNRQAVGGERGDVGTVVTADTRHGQSGSTFGNFDIKLYISKLFGPTVRFTRLSRFVQPTNNNTTHTAPQHH